MFDGLDDSDEESKHSQPLENRGTEVMLAEDNSSAFKTQKPDDDEKIFDDAKKQHSLYHHKTGSLASMRDLGMFKQGHKQKDVITSDDFHEDTL